MQKAFQLALLEAGVHPLRGDTPAFELVPQLLDSMESDHESDACDEKWQSLGLKAVTSRKEGEEGQEQQEWLREIPQGGAPRRRLQVLGFRAWGRGERVEGLGLRVAA